MMEDEEFEEEEVSIKKRLRPNRETAPVFLDDSEIPELILPPSSEDLLISGKDLMRALSVYEILRHFQQTLRLTPFRFEDFCVALLIDEQTYLLSEVHIQLLKALVREDDLVGTQHGPQDVRDSINIYLYLCDHLTWPEVLRIYLSSDPKKNSHIIKNCIEGNYPFSPIQNKLALLEHLCDEFLITQSSHEFLNNEGLIKHEDNCRVCYKPGDLLCCETCSAVFHLSCLDPPLKQVPNEEWICPICKLNTVTGITDCMSDFEKHGYLTRQEPIGWDRHGRKYWLLSRRIIVEDSKSDENISYYSSRLQFDELLETLSENDYEKDLCEVINEMKDEIYRQMSITEKLTKTAKGSSIRKSYLEVINEELFIKRSAKLEKPKDESIHNEKFTELESKMIVDDDDLRGGVQTRLKTGSLQPKKITLDPLKNKVSVYNSINSFREDDSVITFIEGSKTLTRTLRKALPSTFNQTNLFKLGLEGNYRQYQNVYNLNQYALNKYQQAEDRDKKRHLSHKFSLTQASDLKWGSYTNIATALTITSLHGTKSMLINIVRQALLYLETQFTQTFMHPNWQVHRPNWIKAVTMCSEPKEFSLALYILESSMKPVLFNSAWHDTLGFTVLQRSTQLERDELKKKDKKDRRDLNDTSTLENDANTSRFFGAGVGVKLVFGKLKHQIWKQKGEEYRLSGIGGWNWLSSTRIKYPICEKPTIEKELCPDFDSPFSLIDISKTLQQNDLPLRKHYPKVYKSSKLDSLLKVRIDMYNLEKKNTTVNKTERKCDSISSLRCYSSFCDPASSSQCYSPLCHLEKAQKANLLGNNDYGDTKEHVDLLQVSTVDGNGQFSKKVILFNSKGQLPPSSRFFNGKYRSILILPTHEMRKLGRNGGLREVTGFSYNCKINNIWPYGLTPRPFFRTIWLLRTHYLNNLHSAALQLRVFWASIRWDDLSMKPPLSGTNTITTESEVQTIEILKRRDLPPFGLSSEYLVRKIIVPIDLPVKQREISTPNRSGLRKRRRPESPQDKGPRMTELWINEHDIELWEIRQFGEKAEKQIWAAKQKAAQEEKQRQLELLRKKNEEQRKLNLESSKIINGSININPAKSIHSRLTNIFQNRGINKIQISSPQITSTSQSFSSPNPNVIYATIRTSTGSAVKIPVQQTNKTPTQQLILRPATQYITANSNQPAIINSISNVSNIANRSATATYIVRSPNIASTRPIIISNSLNGPIVRPINTIQTNVKQSIPLISTGNPQKISTCTTVNAILTSTPTKTIVSFPQSVTTTNSNSAVSTVNISTSSINSPKNIHCVQVKLNDGRTHLVPLSSLAGNNQTLQIAVNQNSPNQLRILTKPVDNSTKDAQNKPILLTGNSILGGNAYILAPNPKMILQSSCSNSIQTKTTVTTVNSLTSDLSKVTNTSKPVTVVPKDLVVQIKSEDNSQTSSTILKTQPNNEEKEFVLTAEMTQEIIRKALMEPSLQPEMSQKLMAYQRHHQEQLDPNAAQKTPLKVTPPLTSRSSRNSRYSRGKYDSDDYIIDFPKNEKNEKSIQSEDDVTRVCKSIIKTIVDKLDKEEKRIKTREINEERRQKKAAQLKQKYRQNHIELIRRSIIRRKAQFNCYIKKQVELQIRASKSKTKNVSLKVSTLPIKPKIEEVIMPHKKSDQHDNSLYCICRKKYDATLFYICCDRCQDWFHGRCVGITSAEAENIGEYICPQCEGNSGKNFLNIKDLSEEDFNKLLKLHKSIQTHRHAWPFLKPVDKRQVPDYYTIIKEPMDLKKIEGRLNNRVYKKMAEYIYDMNKMFDNCRLYNARTSEYYQCAEVLEGFFVTKMRIFREVA